MHVFRLLILVELSQLYSFVLLHEIIIILIASRLMVSHNQNWKFKYSTTFFADFKHYLITSSTSVF